MKIAAFFKAQLCVAVEDTASTMALLLGSAILYWHVPCYVALFGACGIIVSCSVFLLLFVCNAGSSCAVLL